MRAQDQLIVSLGFVDGKVERSWLIDSSEDIVLESPFIMGRNSPHLGFVSGSIRDQQQLQFSLFLAHLCQ